MNTSQGILLIFLAAVASIIWVRAGAKRDRLRAPADGGVVDRSHGDDAPSLPSQHTDRSDAWLTDVAAWGDELDGTSALRRQSSAIAQGEIYASVSADKAAQLQRIGDAA